ncbi:hypothetical protein GCM10023088_34670 [Actinomadura verrucosospora]
MLGDTPACRATSVILTTDRPVVLEAVQSANDRNPARGPHEGRRAMASRYQWALSFQVRSPVA